MASFGYSPPFYVHLTPRGGFVFPVLNDEDRMPAYWTSDNGDHWTYAALHGLPDQPSYDGPPEEAWDLQGTDERLFYAVSRVYDQPERFELYRVTPWPPTPRNLLCLRASPRGYAGLRGRICDRPAHPLSGKRVAEVPGELWAGLYNVPGGVAAIVHGTKSEEPFLTFVTYRFRHLSVQPLPIDDATRAALEAAGYDTSVSVEWPFVSVLLAGRKGPVVRYFSDDGGLDWEQY
jgi:hypothetical protein